MQCLGKIVMLEAVVTWQAVDKDFTYSFVVLFRYRFVYKHQIFPLNVSKIRYNAYPNT